MSAWYVWGALGLYPLTGTPLYFMGSPAVDKATIALPKGTAVYLHMYVRTYLHTPWPF